ncbi:MAG: hypothetical protein PHT48_00295 [Dechloromonas sp.]|nr:hypothetical protein [Dechloromonas sp.]
MRYALLATVCGMTMLAGCAQTGTAVTPLVADKTLALTATTSISLATLASAAAIGGAVHLIYDPLAPNWEIEEVQVSEDTYHFALKMKRYHTGGGGESLQILKRRVGQIQREQGFTGYQILEYSEGIDSQTLGSRRMAEGVVRLVQRSQADSFGDGATY